MLTITSSKKIQTIESERDEALEALARLKAQRDLFARMLGVMDQRPQH